MPRRKRNVQPDSTNEFSTNKVSSKRPRLQQATTGNSRKQPASVLASPFNSKMCLTWFREYANQTGDTVEPDGMEKFCEDIGVEPENAQQMGFFTEAEWMKGMTTLQCDCTVKLQHKLDYLRSMLKDPVTFKNIFRYAFDFARDKDQRSMEIGTAKEMLGLLLGKQWPLFSSFNQYLEQSKFRVINKDQWQNVLEFSRHINTDLSNYDEDGAWPVMLDDFVEWYREQQSPTSCTPMS